jgi:hypothetical protein
MLSKSIKGYKGFPDTFDPLKDKNGHGTHGVSVILKTAPQAVLFIARVCDDAGNIPSDNDFGAVAMVRVPAVSRAKSGY